MCAAKQRCNLRTSTPPGKPYPDTEKRQKKRYSNPRSVLEYFRNHTFGPQEPKEVANVVVQVNVHLWQYVRWHAEANRSSPQSDSCTMAGNDGARVSESRARGSHSTHPCSSTGNMWSLGDSAFKKQLAEGDSFKVRVHMRKKQSGSNYEEVTAPHSPCRSPAVVWDLRIEVFLLVGRSRGNSGRCELRAWHRDLGSCRRWRYICTTC